MGIQAGNILLLLQDSAAIIARIWSYLTQQFTFGRITVSVSSFLVGLTVIILTILIARWSSNDFALALIFCRAWSPTNGGRARSSGARRR